MTLRRLHPEDHPDVANAEQGLGAALRAQGKLTEAEAHYRASLDMRHRLFGSEHVDSGIPAFIIPVFREGQ